MSEIRLLDSEISIPISVETASLGRRYEREIEDLPESLTRLRIGLSFYVFDYEGPYHEDEEDEGEEEEDDEMVTVGLTFKNPHRKKVKIRGILSFSDREGNPIMDVGEGEFHPNLDEVETHIETTLSFYSFRDYQFERNGVGCYNLTLTLYEASHLREEGAEFEAPEELEEELGGAIDLSHVEEKDEEKDVENVPIRKFDGSRKLKEFVMQGSSEVRGWRLANSFIKEEIEECRKTIATFPEEKEKLEAELAELQVEEKVLNDQNKVVEAENAQLQVSINEMEQKNYILDRKLKTHQVISLADQKDLANLISNDLEGLLASQAQLLLFNLATLRKRVLEESGEGDLCLICLEGRRSIVMEPCGHLSVCVSCAGDLSCQETRSCPKCAQPYRRTTRVVY